MQTKIQTTQESITPAQARDILARHKARLSAGECIQRQVRPYTVSKYATDMSAGNWQLSPQPLAFDERGDLLDGQHRLEAVVLSGRTVDFIVSKGWPARNGAPGVIDIVDTGRARTTADLLQMHGTKYASRYAGVARGAAVIARGGEKLALSYSSTAYILDKLNLRAATDEILLQANILADMRIPISSAIAYYWTVKPRKAVAFANAFFNCIAEKGSPIQALLAWHKLPRESSTALEGACAALRAYDAGAGLTVIKPHREAIRWLADTNPELRDKLVDLCPAPPASDRLTVQPSAPRRLRRAHRQSHQARA